MKSRNLGKMLAAVLLIFVLPAWRIAAAEEAPAGEAAPPSDAESTATEAKAAQLRLLAALYAEQGEPDRAIECYEKLLALKPEDPDALAEMTSVCFRFEKYDKALPALEALQRLAANGNPPGGLPPVPVILHGLAICHRAAGNEQKHKELFRQALEAEPDNKEAHVKTAWYFEAYGQMDVVYAELKKALEIPVKSDDDAIFDSLALGKTASYLADEGRYAEAAEAWRRNMALIEQDNVAAPYGASTANSHRYYCEGKQLEMEGKLKEAQEKYEKSARADEDNLDGKSALYLCLKTQGKDEEAKQVFEQAERLFSAGISGEDPYALNVLAWFYAVTGEKIDEGLKLALRAIAAAPRDADMQDTAAELYYKRGDYENAVKHARIALELPKDYNVPYFRRQHEKMKKALEESRAEPPAPAGGPQEP